MSHSTPSNAFALATANVFGAVVSPASMLSAAAYLERVFDSMELCAWMLENLVHDACVDGGRKNLEARAGRPTPEGGDGVLRLFTRDCRQEGSYEFLNGTRPGCSIT